MLLLRAYGKVIGPMVGASLDNEFLPVVASTSTIKDSAAGLLFGKADIDMAYHELFMSGNDLELDYVC
jgi:hypothetical protein